jgi:predicted phosphodiesterase
MRIAVISDIHGNLEALTSTLKDIYNHQIEMIICLGDIVGYGPNPNECIHLVMEHCHHTVMGNHDAAVFNPLMAQDFNDNAKFAIEWANHELTKESRKFLRTLPMQHKELDFTAVHSTPYDPHLWYYISSLEDAKFNFNFFNSKFCFIGHTHIPGIIMLNEKSNEISIIKATDSLDLSKLRDHRFIINVGSVGQPRDRNPKSCYLIIDTESLDISFPRVEYDIKTYQKKMTEIDMPPFLVSRVEEGR